MFVNLLASLNQVDYASLGERIYKHQRKQRTSSTKCRLLLQISSGMHKLIRTPLLLFWFLLLHVISH